MKSSRVLALVLSFNFGIFGGNVYAGDDDPLVEHAKEGLVTEYVKKEQKYTKIYDLSKTSRAISYRRKEDFFSYDELRAITIHNVYSAFDANEGIIPSYLKTIKALGDIISNISYEMAEGKHKIRGETKDDVFKNVLADVSATLSKDTSITHLGYALYGRDVFRNSDSIDIANGVVLSVTDRVLNGQWTGWGVAADVFELLLLAATIIAPICAAKGAVVKGVFATNAEFWAKNGVRKLSKETAAKLASGAIKSNVLRSLGYKALNQLPIETLKTVSEFLAKHSVKNIGKKMAIGAVTGIVLSADVLFGSSKGIQYAVAQNSKNAINTENPIMLSTQLSMQRADNISDALKALIAQLENKDQILNSNILVLALDRRNLNTWIPGLCLANRLCKRQQSWLYFRYEPDIASPTVGNSVGNFSKILDELKEQFEFTKDRYDIFSRKDV